jgi:hypothetical protein
MIGALRRLPVTAGAPAVCIIGNECDARRRCAMSLRRVARTAAAAVNAPLRARTPPPPL